MGRIEEYIKMCEKAVELQDYARALSPFIENDYENNRLGDYLFIWDNKFYIKEDGSLVQIFRQDQLQDMVRCEKKDWLLLDNLNSFIYYQRPIVDKEISSYSMEQLWLAFVMKEKYNKILTGNDWKIGK